jgi:uncharacterized protein
MTNAPPEPQSPQTPPPPASDANTLAMLAHLLGIFTGFVGPLIIWLVKKEVPFVEDQAKEALNFQITVAIAAVASGLLSFIGIGCIIYPVVAIGNLVFCIMACVKAKDGIAYRYPIALRLIK